MSIACRRPCQVAFRSLSTATTAEHKPHTKPGAHPHHASHAHVHKAHLAHGTIAVSKFHVKPEVREAELLKMGREIMPAFVASAPGVWGLPGPRSLFFENHHNEWTSIGLWESAHAMEAFKKSPEHDKLMHKFGALIDVGEMKEQVSQADFHYYEPMRQCNWERYPVEVSEWKVKPGFRKQVKHIITENDSAIAHIHKVGLLFQVLMYNAAETHVVGYSVYRDLLNFESGQHDMEKHLVEWGLADFVVHDEVKKEAKHAKHEHHAHIHHHQSGSTLHSNAWVFSE